RVPIRRFFFCASRRRHTRWPRDWSSDVCSSDLLMTAFASREGNSAFDCNRKARLMPRGQQLSNRQASNYFLLASSNSRRTQSNRSEERRVGKECRSRRLTEQ